ncbi:hypothetical protein ACIQBJ_01820 [Kitasatospora sp. NPDC088391]|uniref:hypothetical protein n=1 Tax=Kitasatospora sp. NPDC088391 TaxID=3364074 RepID=UPI0038056CAD
MQTPQHPRQAEPVESAAHPLGGGGPWGGGGALGRRAAALSGGDEVLMQTHSPYETMTWTSRGGAAPADW